MAGYVVVNDEITDEAVFAEFRERIAATVEAHGGRYLVRGGATEVADGDWTPGRLVILEFDDVDRARAWLNSPEYAELREIRRKSANASVIIAEGV
ncbi:MAG: DUF1330 domain-containing protein [Gemmatimonadaceae bacterium]|nr:DUF1330 domain-containing protein [Gemmatimonadaceae bacterium]